MKYARGLEPADQLDDDLHRGVVDGLVGVAAQRQAGQVDAVTRSREVGVHDPPEGEPAPRALGHLRPRGSGAP